MSTNLCPVTDALVSARFVIVRQAIAYCALIARLNFGVAVHLTKYNTEILYI